MLLKMFEPLLQLRLSTATWRLYNLMPKAMPPTFQLPVYQDPRPSVGKPVHGGGYGG